MNRYIEASSASMKTTLILFLFLGSCASDATEGPSGLLNSSGAVGHRGSAPPPGHGMYGFEGEESVGSGNEGRRDGESGASDPETRTTPYHTTSERRVPVDHIIPTRVPFPVGRHIPYPHSYTPEKRVPIPLMFPDLRPLPVGPPYPVPVKKQVPYPADKSVPFPLPIQVPRSYPVYVPVAGPHQVGDPYSETRCRCPVILAPVHPQHPVPILVQYNVPLPFPDFRNGPPGTNGRYSTPGSSSQHGHN